jgi:hypothetical protein
MRKSLLALFSVCLLTINSHAQFPTEKLGNWAAGSPIEKLYLHCDRDEYLAGQTVWFKAYLYSEFLPNDKASVVFIELINSSSGIISRKNLPVAMAVSRGQFELPDTLSSGKYIIRAYTATMLNQDPDFIYKKSITITGKEKKNAVVSQPGKKIRMEFFPEGGNFVAGMANTMAFKATDEEGWPVYVEGVLKNSKEEAVTEFTSYHDGMGMIDVTTAEKETYYVTLKNDPSGQRYPLPEVISKGIVFRLLNGDDGIHFEIFQPKNDPVFQAAYMIGQIQHNVVFKQPLKGAVTTLSGLIKTSNLTSGILHITVFNKDGLPLAERLAFIDNKEYILPARLLTDTVNFSARGKNHFTLAFTDTVMGSFSVSITDPAYSAAGLRENNIISSLLLTADLKGYIHNPGWYFSSVNDSMKYALDLVMMTNGWRRFKWNQLISDPLPASKYKDPKYITLAGQVTLEGTKKPFADKDMLLFIVGADSSRNMQMIKTDANGYYDADSVLFFGKAHILFSDIRGKKSRFVDIRPGADSLNRRYPVPLPESKNLLFWQQPADNRNELAKKLADEYDAFVRASGVVLSEIVVKSRKKTPLEELEEKYASGAFSGDTRKTFDLLNTDDGKSYLNIFDYLQDRVPGLTAIKNEITGEYEVYYRQTATISALGNQAMDIFLDEVLLADASAVSYIPVSQIAMVKVYSTFVGSTGGGAGGAVAIYLKKGADYFSSLPSAGEIIAYNGFSIIKEYYSPDYSVPAVKNNTTPDHRITLEWNPDIYVAGVNTKIPVRFYNNDRTKSFKVIVEGMTTDGKMLMIEKIISGKGF